MSHTHHRPTPLVGAVAGAKGGVGKSMVCSNLAVQFAKADLKVIVIDCDLGAANQHTLFGISRSSPGWTQWLTGKEGCLKDYLVPTAQENLSLIPASGFIPQVAQMPSEKKKTFLEEVHSLDADLVLFDLGAGSHIDTLDLFIYADFKMIVTTAEPTSLMNNFEFIKNALYRALTRLFMHQPEVLTWIEQFRCDPHFCVDKLLEKVSAIDEWAGENLQYLCSSFDVSVIFNQMKKVEEATMAKRLQKIVQHTLNMHLKVPGFVFYNEEILASVHKMLPLSLISPEAISSQIFERMAKKLIVQSLQKSPSDQIEWGQIKKDFAKNRVARKKSSLHL